MPPRLARLLAAVVAVGLVVGAFAVRGAIAGDDEDAGGSGPSADGGDGSYTVVCDEDLGAEACAALADLPGVTAVETVTWAQVRDGEAPDADAWLTLDPLPDALAYARDGAPGPDRPVVEVASSGVALLAFDGAIDCRPATWTCTAEAADAQDVGLPDLTTSSGVVLAAAAFAAIGGEEVGSRGMGAFTGETADLVEALADDASGTIGDQQGTIVTQRGRYDGILTTGGWAERRASTSGTAGLVASPLAPPVVVGVVLAGLGEQGEAAVADLRGVVTSQTVREALTGAGWEGGPARSDGLPDADVVYALQEDLVG